MSAPSDQDCPDATQQGKMMPLWRRTTESKAKMDAIYAAGEALRDMETGGVVNGLTSIAISTPEKTPNHKNQPSADVVILEEAAFIPPDAFLRSITTPVFTTTEVEAFKHRQTCDLPSKPEVLYCCMIPDRGRLTIVTMATLGDRRVIVGIDVWVKHVHSLDPSAERDEVVHRHLDRLRVYFRGAKVRVFYEANLSNIDADMMCKSLMHRYSHVVCEKSEMGGLLQFGFRTDEKFKNAVCHEMQRSISHLHKYHGFCFVSKSPCEMWDELLVQLTEFQRKSKHNDDLVFAIGAAILLGAN